MDYQELKRQIAKAGLNGKEFAEILGLNKNSISNLASKEKVPDHLAVIAVLMAEMKEAGIDYVSVLSRLELSKNSSRGKGF
ncbi:hypothetical protein [Escherichia coli]|uniref:hypothetical protein n=1 Tax=Escherichia coli TaxID=562 RepID=UPI0003EDBA9D|nr:hypothetical protein [Escherichia coli]